MGIKQNALFISEFIYNCLYLFIYTWNNVSVQAAESSQALSTSKQFSNLWHPHIISCPWKLYILLLKLFKVVKFSFSCPIFLFTLYSAIRIFFFFCHYNIILLLSSVKLLWQAATSDSLETQLTSTDQEIKQGELPLLLRVVPVLITSTALQLCSAPVSSLFLSQQASPSLCGELMALGEEKFVFASGSFITSGYLDKLDKNNTRTQICLFPSLKPMGVHCKALRRTWKDHHKFAFWMGKQEWGHWPHHGVQRTELPRPSQLPWHSKDILA